MDERTAYIALNMMEGIGPVTVRALVAALGSAAAVFDASAPELARTPGIGTAGAARIARQCRDLPLEEELACAEAAGCRIIAQIDEEYPEVLRQIHDPPLALYIRGTLQSRDRHAIAVVGTRRPTHYGIQTAGRLAYQLAEAGFTVLSGLALGIDTVAHEGALKANGRTIAVIGSGHAHLYPSENRKLADQVAEHGALISEFPMQRTPDKTTFPMRNRIVSGLSAGVLVVEAGRRSGAAITATQALSQGRDVFAVPGRIDSYASQGTNELLKHGAIPVTGIDDILDQYTTLLPPRPDRPADAPRPRPDLSPVEQRLVDLIAQGTTDADSLIRASGLGAAAVSAGMISLELKRIVRAQPGGTVALTGP